MCRFLRSVFISMPSKSGCCIMLNRRVYYNMPISTIFSLNIVIVCETFRVFVHCSDIHAHLIADIFRCNAWVDYDCRQDATCCICAETHHLTIVPPCVLVVNGDKLHFGGYLFCHQFCEVVEKVANLTQCGVRSLRWCGTNHLVRSTQRIEIFLFLPAAYNHHGVIVA